MLHQHHIMIQCYISTSILTGYGALGVDASANQNLCTNDKVVVTLINYAKVTIIMVLYRPRLFAAGPVSLN